VRFRRSIEINIYYIPIGVKSTAQIFGPFGDHKYPYSVSRIWFTRESRNATNSKLDWVVVFTARYARRNRKTVGSSWHEIAQTANDVVEC